MSQKFPLADVCRLLDEGMVVIDGHRNSVMEVAVQKTADDEDKAIDYIVASIKKLKPVNFCETVFIGSDEADVYGWTDAGLGWYIKITTEKEANDFPGETVLTICSFHAPAKDMISPTGSLLAKKRERVRTR